MEVGCPTIFTKRATGGEIISNGVNGVLVDPDNTSEIADAIVRIFNNSEDAQFMGLNGARTIRDKFNISTIADLHIKLYSDLINSKNSLTK
jgi:glycosyltransferase involved in cell wall biosynthesis